MTTRFSLAELAQMLRVPVHQVRAAVDTLAAAGELTAESFPYGDRNWRIAPSDTKRIQAWIEARLSSAEVQSSAPTRRIVKRKVVAQPRENEEDNSPGTP